MDERISIVLFDGVCNVCNAAVNFIIDRDRAGRFRFASLQSHVGKSLLREHGAADLGVSSMALIDADKLYTESEAALRVAGLLGGAFRALVPLLRLPRPLRDRAYKAFARNRYRLFGRTEKCRVPTPELRARFLDMAP